MLVLSRGQNDKVVFPSLGISVEVLRLDGKNVRLGIDAPKSVPILRAEIADKSSDAVAKNSASTGGLTHATRNRLQKATLELRMLQRMLDSGDADDAEAIIFRVLNELQSIEQDLGDGSAGHAASAVTLRNRNALVVEDDDNERELLAAYLRLSGFEVNTAMDGLQAMIHLSNHNQPDVVLLDMKMPRLNGAKTVSAIRENPAFKKLKIIAVTGSDPAEEAVFVGPGGVDRWFAKPVDPERLVEAIRMEFAEEMVSA